MKDFTRTLVFILVLTTLAISACSGVAVPMSNSAGDKAQADLVGFTGVIEAMNGTQWTINGQVVTVDPSVIRDGPFQVGDTVKLEAQVAQDGSVMVTRVETPSASAADNGNINSNANESPVAAAPNPSGGNPQPIIFDNGGSEAFGSVDSITSNSVVVGGQTFAFTSASEFKDLIQAGDFVKVRFSLNADGTYSIVEIEYWDPALVSNDNSNSNSNLNDNSNSNANSNINSNSNDNDNDNGDDHGGNRNDNDDDDDDDNDDHGGNDND